MRLLWSLLEHHILLALLVSPINNVTSQELILPDTTFTVHLAVPHLPISKSYSLVLLLLPGLPTFSWITCLSLPTSGPPWNCKSPFPLQSNSLKSGQNWPSLSFLQIIHAHFVNKYFTYLLLCLIEFGSSSWHLWVDGKFSGSLYWMYIYN